MPGKGERDQMGQYLGLLCSHNTTPRVPEKVFQSLPVHRRAQLHSYNKLDSEIACKFKRLLKRILLNHNIKRNCSVFFHVHVFQQGLNNCMEN